MERARRLLILLFLLGQSSAATAGSLLADLRQGKVDPAQTRKWQKVDRFRPHVRAVVQAARQTVAGAASSQTLTPAQAREVASAAALLLMADKGVRVGSHRYAVRQGDGSYGATSIRRSQVRVNTRTGDIELKLPSKGKRVVGKHPDGSPNRRRNVTVLKISGERDLARVYDLFKRQAPAGQDGWLWSLGGERPLITERSTQALVRPSGGTNHNWRHLLSDSRHAELLAGMPRPRTRAEAEQNVLEAASQVQRELGHKSVETTLRHYCDPRRLQRYLALP